MKEILYISACEALSTVKRKYKMDEKIELMINNWILNTGNQAHKQDVLRIVWTVCICSVSFCVVNFSK